MTGVQIPSKKNKLGFPLEYTKLAEFYDILSQGSDNSTINKILRKYKVKTVLDLTCGTGAQSLWLAKHGYQVVGIDISPKLLKIAKDKAKKEKIDCTLLKGDMRTLLVGKFDAAISMFNAIGHLTKADFEMALKNVYANLRERGLYVFDIFNLDAMNDDAVNNLAMDLRKEVNDITIRNVQYSELDKKKGRLTSYDQFTIQKGTNKPEILEGKFTLQLYSAQELKEILNKNGFETLGQYGMDGSIFVKQRTLNILTVARRCK